VLQVANARPIICRTIALASSLVSAVAAILLFVQARALQEGELLRFVVPWIKSYSIHFALGIDGLNLLPVIAAALVFPILLVSEWERQFGRRGIHALFLVLETAILGALCSLDLFLLLFFVILIPIPLYFLASIWGEEGREISAFRMISTALVASACLFFGVLLIYHAVDPHSFLIEDLRGKLGGRMTEIFGISIALENVAFPLIVFGLALRAPIWPLHGWFRKLALKVPATVVVAAIFGGYPVAITVLSRIGFGLFPETMNANLPVWIGIGIANLVFGMLSLLQEKDLRGVLVSLSTLFIGTAMIGVGTGNPSGLIGSQFILFSTTLCLAVMGFSSEVLRHRTWSYSLADFGGVLRQLPDLGCSTLIAIACGVGIPGTVGFVALALLFMGAYGYNPAIVLGALFIFIIVTGFLIQMFRQVFLGEKADARYARLSFRERLLLIPLTLVIVAAGFLPSPFVEIVRASVATLLGNGNPGS
jgi:NADH-quinone oxidoreductase subunit M